MKLEMLVSEKLGKAISESSNQEIYQALMAVVQDMAEQKESNAGEKESILCLCRVFDRKTFV